MLLRPPDRERGFKKERILRVLSNHPDGELSKYRVAMEAETAESWVHEYTERLESEGLLADTTIRDPRALYEEWRDVRVSPKTVSVSLQQPMDLLRETDRRYALTTYRAETLVQGYLFPSTTDFYVSPADTAAWTDVIENEGLLGGGNTRVRVTDDHVFYGATRRDGYAVVSTPQLIVDLLEEGGPCEEAAEQLIASTHRDDS